MEHKNRVCSVCGKSEKDYPNKKYWYKGPQCKLCYERKYRQQLKKVCHYSNLQPLWAKDNLSKGIK